MSFKKITIVIVIGFLAFACLANAWTLNPVDPVSWRDLVPFLGEIDGWTAEGDAEGSSVSMLGIKISEAERGYSDENRTLMITITDAVASSMMSMGLKMSMNFEIDSSEEYVKKIEIQGFPGVEKYNYADKEAEVVLILADRFIVQLEGEDFEDTKDLVKIADSMDLKGIAALAK
jgi:hypothetical protein